MPTRQYRSFVIYIAAILIRGSNLRNFMIALKKRDTISVIIINQVNQDFIHFQITRIYHVSYDVKMLLHEVSKYQ